MATSADETITARARSTRARCARVGARLWGPGRFGPALRRVVRDGRVRRVGRRTWAAVD